MINDHSTVNIFTLGFAQKSAERFFSILQAASVKKLIDVRLNNESQLAGFTKKKDLQYFLKTICNMTYEHRLEFAPTQEMLQAYKKKQLSWQDYAIQYNELLKQRNIHTQISLKELDRGCLLCSEPKADRCHRRLLAEYFKNMFSNVHIVHL